MATVSNLLVLLDLLEAGLRINSSIATYIRQKEEAGQPIDADALKLLAQQSDEAFKKLKEAYNK